MTRALVRDRPCSSRTSSHSPSSSARSASAGTPLRRQTSSSPPRVIDASLKGTVRRCGARLVLLGLGLQRGAQRRGEAAPATSGQAGEVLLECVDARVGFELIRILGRQRNAFGAYDDADGARLTIGRARVLGHLRDLAGHEVAVAERARELEMQLRKTQRQTLTGRPAVGRGPHNKCVGCDGLTQTSEAGFDRSSSETPHIVRLAVEPHPGGQRRANLRR